MTVHARASICKHLELYFYCEEPDPSVGDTPMLAGEVERVPRPGSRVRGAGPDIITTQFIAATQASRHVSHAKNV